MTKGRDYTLSGNRLTLKAPTLTGPAGDRPPRRPRDTPGRVLQGRALADQADLEQHAHTLERQRTDRLLAHPHPVPGRPAGDLTSHFCSGAKVTYHVTKSGGAVIGTTS
ncbi:hypothetical protein ACWDBW_38350 [Streptomyces sp. NPDC001107]